MASRENKKIPRAWKGYVYRWASTKLTSGSSCIAVFIRYFGSPCVSCKDRSIHRYSNHRYSNHVYLVLRRLSGIPNSAYVSKSLFILSSSLSWALHSSSAAWALSKHFCCSRIRFLSAFDMELGAIDARFGSSSGDDASYSRKYSYCRPGTLTSNSKLCKNSSGKKWNHSEHGFRVLKVSLLKTLIPPHSQMRQKRALSYLRTHWDSTAKCGEGTYGRPSLTFFALSLLIDSSQACRQFASYSRKIIENLEFAVQIAVLNKTLFPLLPPTLAFAAQTTHVWKIC